MFRLFPLALPFVALANALAHQPLRPVRFSELGEGRFQNAFGVSGATVAWKNVAALKRDFPFLRAKSPEEIDAWILRHFAVLTEKQLALQGIRNSDISTNGTTTTVFHPPEYRRASISSVSDGGNSYLVDLKGTGLWSGPDQEPLVGQAVRRLRGESFTAEEIETLSSRVELLHEDLSAWRRVSVDGGFEHRLSHMRTYVQKVRRWHLAESMLRDLRRSSVRSRRELLRALQMMDHSNGLMSLQEAVAEVLREQMAEALFEESSAVLSREMRTVGSYFVIALPVEIFRGKQHPERAAIVGRQAHWPDGHRAGLVVPEDILRDMIGEHQQDAFGAMVDFFGVIMTDSRFQSRYGYSVPVLTRLLTPLAFHALSPKRFVSLIDRLGPEQSMRVFRDTKKTVELFIDRPEYLAIDRYITHAMSEVRSLLRSSPGPKEASPSETRAKILEEFRRSDADEIFLRKTFREQLSDDFFPVVLIQNVALHRPLLALDFFREWLELVAVPAVEKEVAAETAFRAELARRNSRFTRWTYDYILPVLRRESCRGILFEGTTE